MKITVEDFNKIESLCRNRSHVEINKRARKPAYKVDIDFGNEIGIKSTSAQITDLYNEENLVGKQVICCVNLPAIHIGSVKVRFVFSARIQRKDVSYYSPRKK